MCLSAIATVVCGGPFADWFIWGGSRAVGLGILSPWHEVGRRAPEKKNVKVNARDPQFIYNRMKNNELFVKKNIGSKKFKTLEISLVIAQCSKKEL